MGSSSIRSAVEHWKVSRHRLAQRALKLRKRLSSVGVGHASLNEKERTQKAHLLKDKIRCDDHAWANSKMPKRN